MFCRFRLANGTSLCRSRRWTAQNKHTFFKFFQRYTLPLMRFPMQSLTCCRTIIDLMATGASFWRSRCLTLIAFNFVAHIRSAHRWSRTFTWHCAFLYSFCIILLEFFAQWNIQYIFSIGTPTTDQLLSWGFTLTPFDFRFTLAPCRDVQAAT